MSTITPTSTTPASSTTTLPRSLDQPSSAIIIKGNVFTCESELPWAQAVVITPPLIAHVAKTLKEAQDYCHNKELVVVEEVEAPLVLPGFIDAHCHPLAAGVKIMTADTYCDISKATSMEEALMMMRRSGRDRITVMVVVVVGVVGVVGGGVSACDDDDDDDDDNDDV